MKFLIVLLALPALANAVPASAQIPAPTPKDLAMLSTLRKGHPRIIGLDSDLQRCKGMIARYPQAREWRDKLRAEAEKIVGQPPVEHVLIGPRLLTQSRRALDRIYTLALMYRLEGDKRLADRARTEMLTACAFKDWNPTHFLDVAEMTHAMAIGYDWLYDTLSPEDRATIRNAIVNLGLKEGVKVYEKKGWWVSTPFNWNQVCNGGLTIGALAVADEEPDLAAYILSHAVASLPKAMKSYAPDGGWAEGPGYWTYATDYNVYMLAALESALGTDFGLSKAKGFRECGLFRLQFAGPNGRTFNFADAGDREDATPILFWMARSYNKPIDAWIERMAVRTPHALDVLWYSPAGTVPVADKVPLDALYSGIDVAFFRSAWDDPNATFIGFKGGDNAANHSHLDLGTYVMDADGVRWAMGLGPDNYDLPGYFGKERFTYYRLKTVGQNTITLDDANQNEKAKAPITSFNSNPDRAFAVADLSDGYAAKAKSVRRGIALLHRRDALIQDEVESDTPVEYTWTMHTEASIKVSGDAATLTRSGKTLTAHILSPKDARFEVAKTDPGPGENPNTGVSRLMVRLPAKITSARVVVLLSPGSPVSDLPPVTPLSEWK